MSRLAMVAMTLLAMFGSGQLVFAQEKLTVRCVCGRSTGSDAFNAGRAAIFDSVNASANERDSGINDRVPTPQALSRHQHRSSATDAGPRT